MISKGNDERRERQEAHLLAAIIKKKLSLRRKTCRNCYGLSSTSSRIVTYRHAALRPDFTSIRPSQTR